MKWASCLEMNWGSQMKVNIAQPAGNPRQNKHQFLQRNLYNLVLDLTEKQQTAQYHGCTKQISMQCLSEIKQNSSAPL